MKTIFMLLLALTAGCVPIQHNGKTYYLILGAGVIRVQQTNAVVIVKSDSLGVYAGDGHFNVGLASVYCSRVPTNAQVVLEVR